MCDLNLLGVVWKKWHISKSIQTSEVEEGPRGVVLRAHKHFEKQGEFPPSLDNLHQKMAFKLIDKFLDKHVFDIELEC
jgi:hypothetical protein